MCNHVCKYVVQTTSKIPNGYVFLNISIVKNIFASPFLAFQQFSRYKRFFNDTVSLFIMKKVVKKLIFD